jgi:uncharacterized Zn finger protein (UPF0148 family)
LENNKLAEASLNLHKTKNLFAMPKFCNQCGAPLQEGVRFCTNCGAQVAVPTQQPKPQQEYKQPQQPQQPQPSPKKTLHEFVDAADDKPTNGIDWKQFKPKIEIGKPQITFISKGKLIAIAIGVGILILIALFSK